MAAGRPRKRKRTCKGKRRYRDVGQARSAMRSVTKHSERQKSPVRAYYCVDCNGVHLTSRPGWA